MKNRLISILILSLASSVTWAIETSKFWDDPEFVNRFMGSYGFLSGAEPKISEDEIELFQDLLEIIKVNPRAGAARLQQEIKPESSAALYFILGNLYYEIQDLDSAAKYYGSAIKKYPDYRRAHKNLGLLNIQDGNYPKALVHLTKAVELGDRDGRNYGLIGYAYLNNENYLSAEEAYRQAVLQEPDVADWKQGLAQCLIAKEDYKTAKILYDNLIAENPDNADFWMLQANAFLGLGQTLEAAINLEIVRDMGAAQRDTLSLLGNIYMNLSMPDRALDAYQATIEIDKGTTSLDESMQAAAILTRYGSYTNATELLDSIKAKYATALTGQKEIKFLNLSARVKRSLGEEAEAADILKQIIAREPANGEALLELADYEISQGEVEQGVFYLERARAIREYEFKALVSHAKLLVRQRDYVEGAKLLREALKIEDDARIQTYLERVERASKSI